MHSQWKNVFNILLMQQSCRTTPMQIDPKVRYIFLLQINWKISLFFIGQGVGKLIKICIFYLLQMVFYTSHSYLAFENSCVLIDIFSLLLDVLSTTRIKNVNALLHWWLFYELTLFYVDFRPLIQYLNLSSPLISTNVPWKMQRNSARDKWG